MFNFIIFKCYFPYFIKKELCEKLPTDLLNLKEFIGESKAEYDRNTNNTGVFHGLKRFRIKDLDGLFTHKRFATPKLLLSNITLYAVNHQNYEREITISDAEKTQFLHTRGVTRCTSPVIVYDSFRITPNSFYSWHKEFPHTEIENKTYRTNYSVTNAMISEVFATWLTSFKVNVPAQSTVKCFM